MRKVLAIIAGEPNSISSEIIFKSWKLRKKFQHKSFFIIGSIDLLNKQIKKLKYNIKIKEIDHRFNFKDLNSNNLPVYDVKYIQKKAFEKISVKSSKYILKSFDLAVSLIMQKKIHGIINCPISKKHLLKNKYEGITEFFAQKLSVRGKEVMLIYNKKLSVSPITTHIPLSKVKKKISRNKIIEKIKTIDSFYRNQIKKKPTIGVLGFNPHNYSTENKSEEKDIIIPAIKFLKMKKIKVFGPISPDSSFLVYKKHRLDVIVGMYHDQVLTPFKLLFKYNAINITLGLPILRISPDHGTAEDIVGKNLANPTSLIDSIKFFNYTK